jgi:RNA recognition motif-containing protein
MQTVKYANKQKHKVYVCNIPRHMDRVALQSAFKDLIRGLVEVDVTMQKDQGKPDENRGFCFLDMYNQTAAEQAIDVLNQDVEFAGECVLGNLSDCT